jgi:flagellar motor switch protein FliM
MEAKTTPETYDFAHSGKLSPAEVKWLGYLHTGFAKKLEMALACLMRDYVEVGAGELTETRWSQLISGLPSPCSVFMFEAPPLKGKAVLRIDRGLAFALVDRLFGGTGEAEDLGRELTSIEQRVVGRFADAVLVELESAWKRTFAMRISRTGFASSPDRIEASRVDEPLIEIAFNLKTGSLSGGFSIAYPHHVFEPAIQALAPRREGTEEHPIAEGAAEMVKTVSLPVTVRLAPTMVDIEHLVDLRPGDVLLLDNRVSEDVEVTVGDKTVMKGRPGSHGGRLAVKITRFGEEGG